MWPSSPPEGWLCRSERARCGDSNNVDFTRTQAWCRYAGRIVTVERPRLADSTPTLARWNAHEDSIISRLDRLHHWAGAGKCRLIPRHVNHALNMQQVNCCLPWQRFGAQIQSDVTCNPYHKDSSHCPFTGGGSGPAQTRRLRLTDCLTQGMASGSAVPCRSSLARPAGNGGAAAGARNVPTAPGSSAVPIIAGIVPAFWQRCFSVSVVLFFVQP